jgi:predicted amidohydrolase YtcJ
MTPDLVVVADQVLTLDHRASVAEGVAVADGRVTAVGSRRDILRLVGPSTRVLEVPGGTALPGINDAHCHVLQFGLNRPPLHLDVGYPSVRSIADVVARVSEATSRAQPGQWILGSGWDPGFLAECEASSGRTPTRHDLDPVSPRNPIFLHDFSYHSAWVNSLALELGPIDRTTPEPAGSTIGRDPDGSPNGLLTEGARYPVRVLLPRPSHDDRVLAIKSAQRTLNELGVTSYTEPGIGPGDRGGGMAEGGMAAYCDLVASGASTARVTVLYLPAKMSEGLEAFRAGMDEREIADFPEPRVARVVGVKMFADGIPPNRTAWMHDEYVGGGFGGLLIPGSSDDDGVDALRQMVRLAHDRGFQVGVHVTGDRAIDEVVDAFATAQRELPRQDPRHYVIHGDLISEGTLAKCARLGVGVNMNPTIKWTTADLAQELLGPERAAYAWPYRSALNAGVSVTSGSDAPITFPDWRQGVSTMLLRESRSSGRVYGAEQRIGLVDALRTYTTAPARQDFAESWKGSLEVGMVADICVLGDALTDLDPHDIPQAPVVATVVGGRTVFEA